jgi:hypothetical protein
MTVAQQKAADQLKTECLHAVALSYGRTSIPSSLHPTASTSDRAFMCKHHEVMLTTEQAADFLLQSICEAHAQEDRS